MNNFDTLICFFFFSLGGRNTGLINAEILVHTGEEGGNITVGCFFTLSGKTKFFCKEPCEQGDILIKTEEDTAESGRYSIKYKEVGSKVIYVTITKLIKSDAGKYRCGLYRSLLPSSSSEIEITVEEARISSQPTVTVQPSSASVPSASTETTTQSVSSSTGSCTPPSAPPEGTETTQKTQTTGVQLYVRLPLVVMIIVLSASVLMICSKRTSKARELPVESDYVDVSQANQASDEITEEASPGLEMSAVQTFH
ncbi:uncharacterized protein LOC119223748 isoform X2 [Pungitius pungitius]|uniref:uncharacterized protein LOC119223748 isoform X2 n=1 Tax=Pungitius pungitius TaxID=134920 RepID=UPI002E13D013